MPYVFLFMGEFLGHLPTEELVYHGMRQAIWLQAKREVVSLRDGYRKSLKDVDFEPIPFFIEQSTSGNCGESSIDALAYLSCYYAKRFKSLFLIRNEEAIGVRHHTYFLAQDTQGLWCAGSPANLKEVSSYEWEFYQAANLPGLFQKITDSDPNKLSSVAVNRLYQYLRILSIENISFPDLKFGVPGVTQIEFSRFTYKNQRVLHEHEKTYLRNDTSKLLVAPRSEIKD